MKKNKDISLPQDQTAIERKADHISLAFESQSISTILDKRFDYEPILSPHPLDEALTNFEIAGKKLKAPLWISSMTGGTQKAGFINKQLAQICGKHGLGMGLGSCRSLLEDDTHLSDFLVRKYVLDQPLFANLGIAQLELLLNTGKPALVNELIEKLEADGLIIHVNPLQEFFQHEGDRFLSSPLETIKRYIDIIKYPIIVKEVGHGFGPRSLRALFDLPLEAIDFAAAGGTNFSTIELKRKSNLDFENPLTLVGHTCEEMLSMSNEIFESGKFLTNKIIFSGGIKHYLDGYFLVQRSHFKSIYGQAAMFLKYVLEGEEALEKFVVNQIDGLKMAQSFLKVKNH